MLRLPRKPRAIFKTFLRRLRDETALVVLDIFSYLQDFPALALRPGGRGGPADVPQGIAARLAQARRDLDRMERAVAARYATEGRPALAADAVLMLREVAGLGRAVRELTTSGRRRTALTARLGEALEVLAGGWASERPAESPAGACAVAR